MSHRKSGAIVALLCVLFSFDRVAGAASFDVSTVQDFSSALAAAQTNGEDDVITLEPGIRPQGTLLITGWCLITSINIQYPRNHFCLCLLPGVSPCVMGLRSPARVCLTDSYACRSAWKTSRISSRTWTGR